MDLGTDLYRFGVALAIGALVGFERQSRFERRPEPEAPPEPAAGSDSPEARIRAAISAGESSRYPRILVDSDPSAEVTSAELPQPAVAPPPSGPSSRRGETVPDEHQAVGLRTFMLLSLAGAVAARVSENTPWIFAVALLVVGTMIGASYMSTLRVRGDLGLTSEVSAFIVFLLGGLCAHGDTELAGALVVLTTLTLSLKQGLHGLAKRIRREDIHAVLKFAVLTLIILPILPEEPIVVGAYLPQGDVAAVASADPTTGLAGAEVASVDSALVGTAETGAAGASDDAQGPWWSALSVSPRKIWLMVILISAISFTGYVLGKVLGTGAGLVLTGVLGGFVSSTAVSLSYSQKSQESPELSTQFAIGILLANAIMPVRMLIVVGVVAFPLVPELAFPLLAMSGVGGLAALILYLRSRGVGAKAQVPLKNPFEIVPAIQFGLLFGAVLFCAEVAQGVFGNGGLYVIAVVTGLTDVDAISLAVADLVSKGSQPVAQGAITIALAAISNTLVKGGFVATAGSAQLRRITLLSFGLMFLAGVAGVVGIVVLG